MNERNKAVVTSKFSGCLTICRREKKL